MFQNILIGQYVDGSSTLHRLDPRSKLASLSLLITVIFLANNWVASGLVVCFTLLLVALSKVPLIYLYRGMKPILFLVILTFILHLFMTREGEIIFSVGFFTVYEQGLLTGVFIAIRLLVIVMLTSLLTLTTTPIDLTDGLEVIFSPFKKIGLPAHEIALMIGIALRFIPTFMQETEKIMKAQMARGVDFTSGPIIGRVKALLPLLIPLFISAFKRAEDLALAMEARGYRGGEGRTKYRLLVWSKRDTVSLFICAGFSVLIVVLRFV